MSVECKLNEITKVLDSKYDKSNPKGYISGVNWGKIGGNIRWQVDLLNLINSEINSFGISLNDIAHWNEAYSWGDHALAGYGTSNFNPSDLLTDYGFTDNSADWNTAFSWGNHALVGYLTSGSLTGYATQSWVNSQGFLTSQISHADVVVDGDFASQGIMLRGASSGTYSILTDNSANWNTAFGWGNHASAGYALSSALTGYVPYTGATADLLMGANRIGINSTNFGSGGHTFGLSVGGNILASRVYCGTIRDEVNGNTWAALTGTTPNQTLTFGNAGVSSIYMPYGSVGIGISSGVNARLRVRGGSTSTGNCAVFENASPISLLTIQNDGKVFVGNGYTPSVALECNTTIRAWTQLEIGQYGNAVLNVNSYSKSATGSDFFSFNNNASFTSSVGTFYFTRINFNGIAPTSGTAIFNILPIVGTINQTGGANGITRGIYIAPTLTAAADYRAIEATTGNNTNHTLLKLNNGVNDVFCVKGDSKVGFFGVTPASQQTMGASTAGATYTAAEQAMIQKCWDVLRSFGLGN